MPQIAAPLTSALAAALLLVHAAARAQTTPVPDGAWRGALSVSYTAARGNNASLSAGLNADAVRQTARDKLSIALQGLYGESEASGTRELTSSLVRAWGRYDREMSRNTYAFLGDELEKNKLADLRLRHAPSLGVGWHLWREERSSANVFAGYSYNREDLYSGPTRSINEGVLGEESTHKLGAESSLRQRLVVYPSLDDAGEYRAAFDAGLTSPIVGRWSLALNYSLRYQSDPPPGIEELDTVVFAGLQFGWGPR